MSSVQSVINESIEIFDKLKEVMDKYPKAFEINFDKEKGYFMSIDLDLIEIHQEEED